MQAKLSKEVLDLARQVARLNADGWDDRAISKKIGVGYLARRAARQRRSPAISSDHDPYGI